MNNRAFVPLLFLLHGLSAAVDAPSQRANLVQAILSEDSRQQIKLIKSLSDADDPLIAQVLSAWRQGAVFIYKTNDSSIPFLLDAQTDRNSEAKGIQVSDGEPIKDSSGQPMLFLASDLTP